MIHAASSLALGQKCLCRCRRNGHVHARFSPKSRELQSLAATPTRVRASSAQTERTYRRSTHTGEATDSAPTHSRSRTTASASTKYCWSASSRNRFNVPSPIWLAPDGNGSTIGRCVGTAGVNAVLVRPTNRHRSWPHRDSRSRRAAGGGATTSPTRGKACWSSPEQQVERSPKFRAPSPTHLTC